MQASEPTHEQNQGCICKTGCWNRVDCSLQPRCRAIKKRRACSAVAIPDFGSRGGRAEEGRGHIAGSSFRCGDFDRPRRRRCISKRFQDCGLIKAANQIRRSHGHRCQRNGIPGTVRPVARRQRYPRRSLTGGVIFGMVIHRKR